MPMSQDQSSAPPTGGGTSTGSGTSWFSSGGNQASVSVGGGGAGGQSTYSVGVSYGGYGISVAFPTEASGRKQLEETAAIARLEYRLAQEQAGRAVQAQQLAGAQYQFAQETEGGYAAATFVEPSYDPRVAKLQAREEIVVDRISSLVEQGGHGRRLKQLEKKQQRIEQKIQRRRDVHGDPIVRISEKYGPNAGYWRERGAPPPLWLTGGIPQ